MHRVENMRAQSAMDYITNYGWAVLILVVIMALLYFFLYIPAQVVNTSCNFASGVYCNDVIVATNTLTHNTIVALLLTNGQQSSLLNPEIYGYLNNTNTTPSRCSPNYVLPGGSMICTVNTTTKMSIGTLLAGKLYLNATYCQQSSASYGTGQSCQSPTQQIYEGTFAGHIQALESTKTGLKLTSANSVQSATNTTDPLYATITLLGYPLKGATVNFTLNNTNGFVVSPNKTITNAQGVALSSASGTQAANVLVTASYAGLTSNTVIIFIAPETITFTPSNFTFCSSSTNVLLLNNVQYTCTQLSSDQFTYTKGTRLTFSFDNPVTISSTSREMFQSFLINGVPYTTNSESLLVSSNYTIPFNYYAQYYLTETANPGGSGTLSPGSNWYNASSFLNLQETPGSGYTFTSWTCTGTGCYSGSQSTANIIANATIIETANYQLH